MYTPQQARDIVLGLIQLSIIDGQLHVREQAFIRCIGLALGLAEADIAALYHEERSIPVMVSEFERYQQLYRLALIMHSDGRTDPAEWQYLHEIALRMGLNLHAVRRLLTRMQQGTSPTLPAEQLMALMQEQHN